MDYPIVALIVVLVVILVLVYALSGSGTLVATNKVATTLKLGNGTTNVVVPQYVDYDNATPSVSNLVAGIVMNNSPTGSLVRIFNNTGSNVLIGWGSGASGAVDSSKYVNGLTSGQLPSGSTALCTKQGIRASDWYCAADA